MALKEEYKELVRILFESLREEIHNHNQVILEAIKQILKKQSDNDEEFDKILTAIEFKMESVLSKENRILADENIELKKELEILKLERGIKQS